MVRMDVDRVHVDDGATGIVQGRTSSDGDLGCCVAIIAKFCGKNILIRSNIKRPIHSPIKSKRAAQRVGS